MTSPILHDILTRAEQLHAAGDLEQAARLYRQVLQSNPSLSRTAYNLGIILNQLQDYGGAAAAFTTCLATEPNLLEARLNQAFALQEQGLISEAATRYHAIIGTNPNCIEARFNLACLQLLQGNLTDGLNGYELRFSTNDPVTTRHHAIPLWSGESKPGLRLLIHAEQGYGDTIQMLRYLPELINKGLTIALEVPAPLFPLCSRIEKIHCLERGGNLPAVDYRLPIMSLPRIMGTTQETLPGTIPYLTPDPERINHWKRKLSATKDLRVGLSWAGRMDLPVNRKRSCPPHLLQPLLELNRISFISLQTSPPDGFQLSHPSLCDYSADLTDFHQTAALMANLDLVITIDTAVAHLAGALGIPTWLLLPTVPDWRWLLDRDDSPWYPSMRLFRQSKPGEWLPVIERIIRLLAAAKKQTKGSAKAWYRLGTRQLRQGRLPEATDHFRQALAQQPDLSQAWHNLAHACHQMLQHDEALTCYRRALLFCPNDPCTLNNMGVLLREMGRLDESLQIMEQLVTLYPDDGDGHWNRALSLLSAGDYKQGWQEYEWRFRRSKPVQIIDPGTPRWQGEPLDSKTILLCCEQAYGDSIQFVRFAATLADWGATVLIHCPDRSLADLLASAPGINQTITTDAPLPTHDYWSPLLSLPYHLNTMQENIPTCPYLFASKPASTSEAPTGRLKVGLVWSGRSTDPQRACPAELFAPLARFQEQVTFFSLQLNSSESDLARLQELLGIIDLAPQLTDFQATATCMQQLDLIISIDSAPAHLAGAMGRETWLLLHHSPDWRWGLTDSTSVWYPTIRLFRQPESMNWQPVINQVATALDQRIGAISASTSVAATDDLLQLADRLRDQEQWSAAHHLYSLAADHDPASYHARLCAGGCLIFLNRPIEAEGWFRQAIQLKPKEPDAHINLGLALLSYGKLSEGWCEFDWRCHAITQNLPPIPSLPAILPENRLDGVTVLLHTEQGYGDLIQFARYLPLLAATGARVVVSVPQVMLRLISRITGVAQIIPHGELLPETDYQLPLLSLPERLSPLIQGIPCQTPYLSTDSSLQATWLQRLSGNDTFKVGLVWRGSNLAKSGYRRAMTADLLIPLTEVEGVTLYSLQLGTTPEELALLPGITDLAPHISDFSDTAAIMAHLDLMISIDTSTAHLAGALDIRCWVPLIHSPDWRWHPLHEQGSRWYPSLSTFRQTIPGRWEPVVMELAAALRGEALLHKGHQLGRAGRRKDAIALFRQATALPSKNGPAFLNLGIYLRADGQLLEAKEALCQATEADPNYPEAWQNLGMTHQDLMELPEAYTCLKKALALRPDYATAHWNLGLLQLLLGEYSEGFRNFEARFDKIGAVARLHTDIPAWNGSSLKGKRILIHAEQGYGDIIQFVRFIPQLVDAGAQVILEVQDNKLLELCRTTHTSVQVVVRGDALPAVDFQAPLLSLPYLLGSSIDTIPRKIPYLSADKDKINLWQSRLPDNGRKKIGICWKGRPTPDPHRSIPFKELVPLFDLPDIIWVSLQMDRDDSAVLPGDMVDLTSEVKDFSDTAALMNCLDLVISIDSAVAHLAGALGVPGIVLLPFAPDWRWTMDQPHNPWYPGLQLLRQQTPGEWKPVITALFNSLTQPSPAEVPGG